MSFSVNNVNCQQASFGRKDNDGSNQQKAVALINYLSNAAVFAGLAADSYCRNNVGVHKAYHEEVKNLQQEIGKINPDNLTTDSKAQVTQECEAVAKKLEAGANKQISFFDRYINMFKGSEKEAAEKDLETFKDKKLIAKEGATDEVKQAVSKVNAGIERLATIKGKTFFETLWKIVKDNKWFSLSIAVPLIGYWAFKGLNARDKK